MSLIDKFYISVENIHYCTLVETVKNTDSIIIYGGKDDRPEALKQGKEYCRDISLDNLTRIMKDMEDSDVCATIYHDVYMDITMFHYESDCSYYEIVYDPTHLHCSEMCIGIRLSNNGDMIFIGHQNEFKDFEDLNRSGKKIKPFNRNGKTLRYYTNGDGNRIYRFTDEEWDELLTILTRLIYAGNSEWKNTLMHKYNDIKDMIRSKL